MFVYYSDGTRVPRAAAPEYPVVTLPCPRCNTPVEQYDSPGRREVGSAVRCDDCAWLPDFYIGPDLDTVPTNQLIQLYESRARPWSTALDSFLNSILGILIQREALPYSAEYLRWSGTSLRAVIPNRALRVGRVA
jgi:hypothetical protein